MTQVTFWAAFSGAMSGVVVGVAVCVFVGWYMLYGGDE